MRKLVLIKWSVVTTNSGVCRLRQAGTPLHGGWQRAGLALHWGKDEYWSNLGVHRHLLAQSHAERGVDLNGFLFDGDVLLQCCTCLEKATERVLELAKFLFELTDCFVDLVNLRL